MNKKLHFWSFFSINEVKKYNRYARTPRRKIPVITRFKLNTCDPYIIKYPNPSLDTRNSPIITPLLPLVRENR